MATLAATHAPLAQPPGRLLVARSELEVALDELIVAYENAVAAANEDLLDFGPFDGLPEAIRILRDLLRSST